MKKKYTKKNPTTITVAELLLFRITFLGVKPRLCF